MAIRFQVDQSAPTEQGNKVKHKNLDNLTPAGVKWTRAMLVLSIIGTIYALSYVALPLLTVVAGGIMWIVWLAVVMIASVFTIGMIWFNEGWCSFNDGFMAFNGSISNSSLVLAEAIKTSFPYVISVFALFTLLSLITSIVGYKKSASERGYKGRMIASIIFAVLFVIFAVVDILFFTGVLDNPIAVG